MEKTIMKYIAPELETKVLLSCAKVIAASDDGDPLKLPGTTFDDFIFP